MAAQYYKINYKSDFVLTINSDAGWAVPFCIKFWTGMPSHGYFAGFDGENYVNCRVGETPTQLLVMFDDHHMPIGPLRMQIAYHTTIEEFPDRKFDEVTNPTNVTVDIDGTEYQVMLDFTGETGAEIDFSMPSSGVMSVNGKIGYVTLNAEDVGAQPTIEDLATIRSGAAAGATAVQPAELQQGLATKQNVINDLATIRSGAAAGATAVQPAALQEGLATKQDVISDLATIRSGAAAGATAVQPAGLTPIQTALQTIEAVIPSAASSQNQLADKNFVNSSISTNTANFVGELALGAVYDVSAHNNNATFTSLSALLSDANLSTLIPVDVRKGGMSVKFVQSSNNKYVQYRYMGTAITGSPNPFLNTANWQGVDTTPTAGSKNLITSDAVYNESKKSDVILAVDDTDLAIGYYYNNTTGEKVANQNCRSKLMDIPTKTKEINVIWGGPYVTVAFYGIAIYDAPIAELTDENISDHFIKGFTNRDLLEVSRIIVNDSYKSIAVTIGNTFSSQVLFNALESCIHYGSRLLDVFYLNDNYSRSMVGKSVYLRTLDKTTGIVSLRDPVTGVDYNVQSTVKKGKELLLSKNANYVYLGVLVDWDIIDYNFSNISQAVDNTFVLSTPKSAEGQKFFDMIYNKKYRQTGNTTVNGDGVVSEFDCVWEDGTAGHVAYNAFDDDVLEYRSSIVTYGVSYAVYYGLKTFDEYGNITSETGLEIRVI